ncbi:MAG: hypothetical protein M3033_15795 [Acidobacteriota bacterium]|nr:hypothetical protein [Acidobacteriota bacterium]
MAKKSKPEELPQETKVEPEILVNDYGSTRDSTVVVEEATRTVLLTDNETIIIEKEPCIDIVPKNRPRKIYAGMWGSAETATVGLGLLAVLAVIILVVLVVLPAQKELERNKLERDRLETELISTRGKYGDITSTETQVAKLITSVNDFEARFLPAEGNGRGALYQRINGLIAAYGLINTTGPEYAPLEIADQRRAASNETERGRAKFQSLFPGVYVTTTVQGSYQNLRRFIRDIETSDQFIVISSIEFQPAENEDKQQTNDATTRASINNVKIVPQQAQNLQNVGSPNSEEYKNPNQGFPNPNQRFPNPNSGAPMTTTIQTQTTAAKAPRGKTHGETVSLHLEMAAYFRRPNVSQTMVGNIQQ